MTQNTKKQYVCTEFISANNGVLTCKTWQELKSQPFLPSLTKEQANDITLAVLYVIFLAFGWFLLIRLVRNFK